MSLQNSFAIEKVSFAFLRNNVNQLHTCLLGFFSDPAILCVPAVLIGVLFITSIGWAAESSRGTSAQLILEMAVSLAVKDNPGLAETQARSQAFAAIPSQAGTLPDPVVSFVGLNLPTDTFNTAQEPTTQLQLGISQAIPFLGKLGLREEAAVYEYEAAISNVDETRLRLIRNVKTTWWLLFYLDRALEIVSANQALLRQFVEIAQTKYMVGEGLQQDVLLAQLELSRLLNQELQLIGMRRNEAARLNALLDRAGNSPVFLPKEVDIRLANVLSERELYPIAKKSSPLLAQRESFINVAQTRLKLAKKDYFPDFNVGAFYGFRSGDNPLPRSGSKADVLSLKLSMNVPIFAYRKQAKAVDQRNSEMLQQKYSLQDEWAKVQARITASLADYHQSREQFVLFKTGIIPQARQTVASMLAGYRVNKVDFLNLVRSQITLFNTETQSWRALSEANQSLARLVAAVGEENIYE